VGAVVEFVPDVVWAQGLIDTYLTEHDEQGSHKVISLPQQASTPTNPPSNKVKIYTGDGSVDPTNLPVLLSSTGTKHYFELSNGIYRQAIINGNFDVWQRGTSFTGTPPYYTADRWQGFRVGGVSGATFSRQDTNKLINSSYYMRVQRNSGNSSTSVIIFGTALESPISYLFRDSRVTLSFYARKGSDYSGSSSTLAAGIIERTVENEPLTTVATFSHSNNFTLTPSWTRFTFTTPPLSSNLNTLKVAFHFTPTGTAGGNDFYDISQVQLNIGDIAFPFYPKSYHQEYLDCLRYYKRLTNDGTSTYKRICMGNWGTSTTGYLFYTNEVPFRVIPSLSYSNISHLRVLLEGVQWYTTTGLSILNESIETQRVPMTYTVASSGATSGLSSFLALFNTSGNFLEFNAEL
jgi:hypothetical protein